MRVALSMRMVDAAWPPAPARTATARSKRPPIVGSPWKMRAKALFGRDFSSDEPGVGHRDEAMSAFSAPIASETRRRNNLSSRRLGGAPDLLETMTRVGDVDLGLKVADLRGIGRIKHMQFRESGLLPNPASTSDRRLDPPMPSTTASEKFCPFYLRGIVLVNRRMNRLTPLSAARLVPRSVAVQIVLFVLPDSGGSLRKPAIPRPSDACEIASTRAWRSMPVPSTVARCVRPRRKACPAASANNLTPSLTSSA